MKPFQSLLAVAVIVGSTVLGGSAYACGSCGQPEAVCCEARPVCCESQPVVCCRPAPPVQVTLCVIDPVTCCPYRVDVCVPAECAGVEPRLVSCRRGLFGRKVLTYQWDCCNHCVEVVITKHGRTIVR